MKPKLPLGMTACHGWRRASNTTILFLSSCLLLICVLAVPDGALGASVHFPGAPGFVLGTSRCFSTVVDEPGARPAATEGTAGAAAVHKAQAGSRAQDPGEQTPAQRDSARAERAETASESEQAAPGATGDSTRQEMMDKITELEQKVREDSTSFDLRFELANAYYDMGSYPSAIRHFRKATELDPASVKAWHNLGMVLNEMGLSEEAVDAYDEALAVAPDNVMALCGKGQAYYGLRRYNEAINLYRKALEIDDKSVEAHYSLGVAFADAEMYREAVAEWNLVARYAPGTDAARAALANIEVVMEFIEH